MPATQTPRKMTARELEAARARVRDQFFAPYQAAQQFGLQLPGMLQGIGKEALGAFRAGTEYVLDPNTQKDVPKDINRVGKAAAQNLGSYLDIFNSVYQAIDNEGMVAKPDYYRNLIGGMYQERFKPEPGDPRLERAASFYADPLALVGVGGRAARGLADPALYRQIADELGGANRAYMSGPQAKALRVAQANAAKPIEEGGLGLRPDNTPEERAAAMGFDLDVYHGTESGDISSFNPNRGEYARKGTGSWMSDDPLHANTYAGRPGGVMYPLKLRTKNFADVDFEGNNWSVSPDDALIRGSNFDAPIQDYLPGLFDVGTTNDAARIARKEGAPGVIINNVRDRGGYGRGVMSAPEVSNSIAVFDPSAVRSRFAAFDPMRRDSSDILAGLALPIVAAPVVMANTKDKRKERKK